MRLLLTLAVLFAGALGSYYVFAPVPKEKPKTTAEKLIGKWKIVRLPNGAPPAGEVTVEFTKDGKLVHCSEGVVKEATYKVEDKTIRYHSEQLPEKDWSLSIKTLTNEELVAGDKYGDTTYKRIATDGRK
jgi:uncharacterized protein (TIGR03066 family)